ncbi:MAG: NarK/NasA family nitrate transporter [Sulfurovum sp.]|uniref:MFS transporter n=1 Tax=Sulfurovum sp. TaxID=1969726 RepID=UPI002867CEB5|nr:MFS transporter [Sulfurovum sp.]MCO4844431.1 NarK/NasA family nitrate transporter [Sulfurovum sp.]
MIGFNRLKGEGSPSTLFAAFLYFDFSFMVWTMLGPLATEISDSLADYGFLMTASETATLLSVPILSGALLRILLGFLVGRIGAKKTALGAQAIVILTLFYVASFGEHISYEELLLVGVGLGFAGASFAVALPQAGQWYPPRLQGVVLGIAGIGNMGVVLGFLFAPKIAEVWGWQSVFLVAAVLSLLVFIVYVLMAKDAPKEVYVPRPKNVSDYVRLLKDRDTWWFNLFYAVSFGAFVGFAMYMKVYLMAMYFDDMELFGVEVLGEENIHVVAGYFAALCIMAGALLRPVGGAIADKIGGIRSLYIFLTSVAVLIFMNAFIELPFWFAILVMFLIMANLGMANGALFQLVPQRFSKDIGIMTGIIGAAGALGGVAILEILGASTLMFGDYTIGFMFIAANTLIAIAGVSLVKSRWRTTWGIKSGGII